jgi:hypothetical protein
MVIWASAPRWGAIKVSSVKASLPMNVEKLAPPFKPKFTFTCAWSVKLQQRNAAIEKNKDLVLIKFLVFEFVKK